MQSSSTTLYLDIPFNNKRSAAERVFSHMPGQYWNALPDHIRRANNLQQFQKLLKPFCNVAYH